MKGLKHLKTLYLISEKKGSGAFLGMLFWVADKVSILKLRERSFDFYRAALEDVLGLDIFFIRDPILSFHLPIIQSV